MTEFHAQIKIDEAKACLQSRCIMQNDFKVNPWVVFHVHFTGSGQYVNGSSAKSGRGSYILVVVCDDGS